MVWKQTLRAWESGKQYELDVLWIPGLRVDGVVRKCKFENKTLLHLQNPAELSLRYVY